MSKTKRSCIFKLNAKEEQAEREKIQQALLAHQNAKSSNEPVIPKESEVPKEIKPEELDAETIKNFLSPDEASFFLDLYGTIPTMKNSNCD